MYFEQIFFHNIGSGIVGYKNRYMEVRDDDKDQGPDEGDLGTTNGRYKHKRAVDKFVTLP